MRIKGSHKGIFLKTLNKNLFSKFDDKYTKINAIILDNSLVKQILNNLANDLVAPFASASLIHSSQ